MIVLPYFVMSWCCYVCLGQRAILNKCGQNLTCHEKITVNKQIQFQEKNEYIKIQTVFNMANGKVFYLLNPVILQIQSLQPKLIYPLKLVKLVNNKAYEVFFHKDNMDGFKDCDNDVLKQLCGGQHRGFCCSCDGRDDNKPYHIRGGQDCNTNQSSAHCLQYDLLWYSVNELSRSRVYDEVVVSLIRTGSGEGTSIKLSHSHPTAGNSMITVTYTLSNLPGDILDYKEKFVLIPQTSDSYKTQLMLIDKSVISVTGKECDKIGVSLETVITQPERCHRTAQSCLQNQPLEFWLKDTERKLQKKPRKYFLEDMYGDDQQVIKSEKSKWSLVIPVPNVQASLSIEIPADDIVMFPRRVKHMIKECVYTDKEVLYILLFNDGYLPETMTVLLHQCNISVTGTITLAVQLSPHSTQHVNMTVLTNIKTGSFYCTLLVTSTSGEDSFVITLQKQHVCVCYPMYTCQCGLDVYYRSMSLSSLIKFYGLDDPKFILCVVTVFLFIIGFIKALLSLWLPISIGEFGLCLFTKSKILLTYQEKSLRKYEVVYNEKGIPVHPITKKPVQILPRLELFILNLCIGYYMLFIGVHWLILKLTGLDKRYQHIREEKSWHQKLVTPITSPERSSSIKDEDLTKKLYGQTDKQLMYEEYRKHKKELKYLETTKSETDFLKCQGDRTVKAKNKLSQGKLPVQQMVQVGHVFFNYNKETNLLKRSGKCYSLCGRLTKHGRRYQFDLGPYCVQMNENVDGVAQKMADPQQIVHSLKFVTELNTAGVHKYITTEPLFPCLNATLIWPKH